MENSLSELQSTVAGNFQSSDQVLSQVISTSTTDNNNANEILPQTIEYQSALPQQQIVYQSIPPQQLIYQTAPAPLLVTYQLPPVQTQLVQQQSNTADITNSLSMALNTIQNIFLSFYSKISHNPDFQRSLNALQFSIVKILKEVSGLGQSDILENILGNTLNSIQAGYNSIVDNFRKVVNSSQFVFTEINPDLMLSLKSILRTITLLATHIVFATKKHVFDILSPGFNIINGSISFLTDITQNLNNLN